MSGDNGNDAQNEYKPPSLRLEVDYSGEGNVREIVERELPDFVRAVRDSATSGDALILHQDAFAADYQHIEFLLLGMAIKYAGLHGITIHLIGENRETLSS